MAVENNVAGSVIEALEGLEFISISNSVIFSFSKNCTDGREVVVFRTEASAFECLFHC